MSRIRFLSGLITSILFSTACAYAQAVEFSPGATSKMVDVKILDNTATDGAGLTGLAYNSGSLVCNYHRNTSATVNDMTLVDATVGTWTSLGFKEVDATKQPGVYQIGIPNAALASGADFVTLHCHGATNMAPMDLRISLKYTDLNEATPGSPTTNSMFERLARLTNASGTAQAGSGTTITLASGANATNDIYNSNTSVQIVGGTGVDQVRCITDYVGATKVATVPTWTTTPDNTSQYVLLATPNCDAAGGGGGGPSAQDIVDQLMAESCSAPAGGSIEAQLCTDIDAILDDTGTSGVVVPQAQADKVWGTTTRQLTGTQTFNLTGDVTGNLSGSVGSVTGAVGSVTGNVGGNVVGSVASVTGAVGSVTGSVGSVTGAVGSVTAGVTVATGGIEAQDVSTGAANKIADHVLRRNSVNVEASSDGDTLNFQSLQGAISKQTNNIEVSGSNLVIYKADGTTVLDTQAIGTTAGANPITSLGTN